MMGSYKWILYVGCVFSSLVSSVEVLGQDRVSGQPTLNVDLDMVFETLYDDNAFRSSDDELAVGERQDRINTRIGIDHQNAYSTLTSRYNMRAEHYQKESQDQRSQYTGQTEFNLRSYADSLNFNLAHNRLSFLNAPDQLAQADNIQELDRFSAELVAKGKPSAYLQPVITGTYVETHFQESEINDNAISALELQLRRILRSTRAIFVSGEFSETSFDLAEEFDYEYRRVGLGFSSQLRQLDYTIEAGRDIQTPKVSTFGDETENEFYQISLTYDAGYQQLTFDSSSFLSDSSSANAVSGQSANTNIGTDLNDLDLVKVEASRIGWNINLNAISEFSINASVNEIVNQTLSENDSETRLFSTRYQTDLTSLSSISVRYSLRDVKFSNDPVRDIDSEDIQINFQKQLLPEMTLGLQYQLIFEEDNQNNNIKTNRISLSLSYNFF